MVTSEEIREKFTEFQTIQQQLEQINQHLEQLQEQLSELEISINAIETIAETPLQNEFLAPIANGIFVKAELANNNTLIVNVGSNVTVEKSIPETVELLKQQQIEISQKAQEATMVIQELSAYAQRLYQEVEQHVSKE